MNNTASEINKVLYPILITNGGLDTIVSFMVKMNTIITEKIINERH